MAKRFDATEQRPLLFDFTTAELEELPIYDKDHVAGTTFPVKGLYPATMLQHPLEQTVHTDVDEVGAFVDVSPLSFAVEGHITFDQAERDRIPRYVRAGLRNLSAYGYAVRADGHAENFEAIVSTQKNPLLVRLTDEDGPEDGLVVQMPRRRIADFGSAIKDYGKILTLFCNGAVGKTGTEQIVIKNF